MKRRWGNWTAGIAGGAALIGAVAASAQTGGFEVTADVSSSLEINDNDDLDIDSEGTTTTLDNRFSLTAATSTPVTSLSFSIGTVLRFEDTPDEGSDTGFEDPFAEITFGQNGANSALNFSLRYTETEVDNTFLIDTDGDFVADDLIVDDGTRQRFAYDLGYQIGQDAPIGFDFRLRGNDTEFSGTDDPELNDSTFISTRATLSYQLLRNARGRVFVGAFQFDEDGPVPDESESFSFGAGVLYEINPATSVDVEISAVDIESTEGTVEDENDGLAARLAYTRDLVNGDFTASYQRDITPESERDTFLIGRTMDFPTATLSASIGYSEADTSDGNIVGRAVYRQDLPDASFSLRAEQRAESTVDSEDILTTSLVLGYTRELTPVMGLSASLGVARTEDIGAGAATESTRADLEIALDRDLTEDWSLRFGYRGRFKEDEDDADSATSNALFATIGRTFSVRP